MTFIGIMSNQNQKKCFFTTITQEQKIIGTFLKNNFVGKPSSFYDS